MMELFTKKLNNRKGFTLIELIVVIAIIGILAAILIPQFSGFSDKAKKAAALAEARTVLTAVEAFHTETGTYTGADAALIDYIDATIAGGAAVANDGSFTYKNTDGKNPFTATRAAGSGTITVAK